VKRHLEENDPFSYDNPYLSGDGSSDSESTDSDDDDWERYGSYNHRFRYEDPFILNSALVWLGTEDRRTPAVVWSAGTVQLQGKIPPKALGPSWDGNMKRSIPFFDIASVECKMNVLLRHTHWGILLQEYCKSNSELRNWAKSLKKRLRYFLEGKHDPAWNTDRRVFYYGKDYENRPRRNRALRLLQVLQSVNGLFNQIYLSDIGAGWNWQMFDNFSLRHLSLLLSDEFLDGELENQMTGLTHYEILKRYRGEVKRAVLRSEPLPLPSHSITEGFKGVIEVLNAILDGDRKIQRLSVISQTRGCGTPPPSVVLKSKIKFLETVSEEPEPLSSSKKFLIKAAVKKITDSIPDYVFQGLGTKSGIRVTASACYERSRKEGGTVEFIRTLVNEGNLGRKIRISDLEGLGAVPVYKNLDEVTAGEYVFWRCLEEVLASNKEDLKKAFLVMIREPGKARTVTKGAAALKVVLDLVNGICSYPLKRVESSSSGMGKAHHGWNFFKEFFTSWRGLTFGDPEGIQRYKRGDGYIEEIVTYPALYVGMTDYSEATDFLHHDVARPIARAWMLKCGIPPVLRGIVMETCFTPRTILFRATGPLKEMGDPTDSDGIRSVKLVRGVLMGDPLTKVILHLINASVRTVMEIGKDNSLLKPFPEAFAISSKVFEGFY